MSKPVILTGIRSNQQPTLGNYFGAILPLIDMAKNKSNEYVVNIFVPDLHSFNTPIDHSQFFKQTSDTINMFIAAGLPLDNPDVCVYRQSYIPAHSELTVILNNFVGFGEMSRMTQFKDKSTKLDNDRISVGLFDYPVLMAADILLYDAVYIPVGDDQTQHLEITRDIAQRMNNKFGDLFTVPYEVKKQHELFGNDQGLRIMDLADPIKKMSKSDETGKGVIFLNDNPEAAGKKIMSATTDSVGEINYNLDNQPGISNLLQILALLQGSSLQEVITKYQGQTSYGTLKDDVAEAVKAFLTDFQAKLAQVDTQKIQAKLESSEAEMNKIANQTLFKVQKAVGLR